jgi:hypothetical protein
LEKPKNLNEFDVSDDDIPTPPACGQKREFRMKRDPATRRPRRRKRVLIATALMIWGLFLAFDTNAPDGSILGSLRNSSPIGWQIIVIGHWAAVVLGAIVVGGAMIGAFLYFCEMGSIVSGARKPPISGPAENSSDPVDR